MTRIQRLRQTSLLRRSAVLVAQTAVAVVVAATVGVWMLAIALLAGTLIAAAFAFMVVTGGLFARRTEPYVDARPSAVVIPIGTRKWA